MFDRWRQAKNEVDDLNLIPIMNLMMTLIPFLLMGAAFYHIGVIPSSLPTHVPQGNPHPDKTKTVTLNLQVLPDKLELSATGNNIPDSELSDMSLEVPKKNGAYDLKALQARLIQIKGQYPKSDTVIVLPDDGISYNSLVAVLDTTREQIIDQGKTKDPLHKPLFPVTVFSRILKPKDGDTGGATP